MFERHTHSGTVIRERMRSGRPWEHLVPPGVIAVIQEIDGIARMRDLDREDGEPPSSREE
jgi:nicotinamide-nucleotide adenylyltransferase